MSDTYRLLRPYLKGIPVILLFMLMGVLVAKKYLSYVSPKYESNVKIKLTEIGEGVPNNDLFKDLDLFSSSTKIEAEIELIKSKMLLSRVLDSLDYFTQIKRIGQIRSVELYKNSPFRIQKIKIEEKLKDKVFDIVINDRKSFKLLLPGKTTPIDGIFNQKIEFDNSAFIVQLNDELISKNPQIKVADHYTFEFYSQQKLIGIISSNLDIHAADKGVAIINISYKDVNKDRAAEFVNKLAQTYIDDYIETKYKAANITVSFLNKQINEIIEKLSDTENHIQSFRDKAGITNITQETEIELQKLSQLNLQKTNIKMELEGIKVLDTYIQNGKEDFLALAPNFEGFTDPLNAEIVKNLKTLQAERKSLMLVYTPTDEHIKLINEKINDLTSYLIESIKNTRKNLEIKYSNIEKDIDEAESAFQGVPEKEKMLHSLNREFSIYEQSFNFLNEKKMEAEIAQAAKVSFHRIISFALPSKSPVSPNRSIILIVSALLGMLMAIFLIFLITTLRAKTTDKQTIESNGSIPVLSLTPYLKDEVLLQNHFLRETNNFDLKNFLQAKNVLCFSAFSKLEGAAFNAYHFAQTIAKQGRNTLLIDVCNQIKQESSASVEAITISKNLSLLSLQNLGYEKLTKQQIDAFIEKQKELFDLIIALNEPLESGLISKSIMSKANLNIIVLDSRVSPLRRIQETELFCRQFELPNVHFLLNRNGYSPNVFVEICQMVNSLKTLRKKV